MSNYNSVLLVDDDPTQIAILKAYFTALKVGDVMARGEIASIFSGTFEANLFIVELLASAIIPAVLFSIPSVRLNELIDRQIEKRVSV